MTTVLTICIDKEIKLQFEEKIKKHGLHSTHDVVSYLIENYINYFYDEKASPEMKTLIQNAPKQLTGRGWGVKFTDRIYISKVVDDWSGKVRILAKGTEYKNVANLGRNMIYAFISLGYRDTIKMKHAIESYRLRRKIGFSGTAMKIRLNDEDIRQIYEIYGKSCNINSLFKTTIQLLIKYEEGEACSEYSSKIYNEFMKGESVDMTRKTEGGRVFRFPFHKEKDRYKIALLMYKANARGPACLTRRIAYVLLHIRDIDCIPEVNPTEDTYEDYLFYDMAKRDYSYQNYRR